MSAHDFPTLYDREQICMCILTSGEPNTDDCLNKHSNDARNELQDN